MADEETTRILALLPNAPERFRRRVANAGDCVVWTGTRLRNGYGLYKTYDPCAGKQSFLAHRVAYYWHTGEDIAGKVIRHHCDNRGCVNPEHLASGTHADNVQDMMDRGRSARGERSAKAKLTAAQVQDIRQRVANGERHWALAAEYGVSRPAISLVASRRRWKHVS
jgi:hypothetical protein